MSTIGNYKQSAAAELTIAIGHLEAALHFWSPISGRGLSPSEEKIDPETQSWKKLKQLVEDIKKLEAEEGPGA